MIVESLNVRQGKSINVRKGKIERGRKGRENLRRISDEIGMGGNYNDIDYEVM